MCSYSYSGSGDVFVLCVTLFMLNIFVLFGQGCSLPALVKLWAQLFKDIPDVTHVLDFGVGTAAAGIGAWRCGMKYEAFCANKVHKDWLDNLMDSCMFAVVADGVAKATGTDKEFQSKVPLLFGTQVAEGMRMLSKKAPPVAAKAQAPVDENPQNNDDDDDDA